MNYNILENEKFYEVVLENNKHYKIDRKWVENTSQTLDLNLEDTISMWLEDNEILDNQEQIELDKKAKENKSNKIVKAESDTKAKTKTPKERVKKDNPDKEYLIGCIAEYLTELKATNINITNKSKLIEFNYNNKEFKFDLIEKRVKKD